MVRESILLQELSLDDIGDFKGQLLILRERIFSDQLHNFVEFDFLMKNFLDLLSKVREFLVVVFIEIFVQLTLVVGG